MGGNESIHTIISYVFGITATVIMLYLGLRHFNDVDEFGRNWGRFALMHSAFGFIGMLGIRLTGMGEKGKRGIFPPFRKMNIASTLITSGVILLILVITQVISAQIILEVTATEQALYWVFSAITEELFFRATICYAFLFPIFRERLYTINSKGDPAVIIVKVITALFSGIVFGLSHVNYYGTVMIYAVTVSGIIMSMWFLFFHASFLGQVDKGYDITGMMLAHFLINLIVAGKWIITL